MEKNSNLVSYLEQFITDERKTKMNNVLSQRTRSLVGIVEDVYDPHNANAVIRSCDAFGIQELHVIENRNMFKVSRQVASGSDRWVELHRYKNPVLKEGDTSRTEECLALLKKRGYSVVATTPHGDTVDLREFKPDGPVAVLFGSEHLGLSEKALELADIRLKIPMVGFCESLNLSVSAAVTLYSIREKLENAGLIDYLDDDDALEVKLKWLRLSIKRIKEIENNYPSQITEST